MITYESLSARPAAFASLCGFTLAGFEPVYQDFADVPGLRRRLRQRPSRVLDPHRPAPQTCSQPRKRAAGGGTPFSQDGRTRLLMALVFLRVYPTYAVLAFFFSLHKANAQRGVVEVLATLEAHTVFVCECPAEDRRKLRSAQRLDPNCVDELRGRRLPRQQELTTASQPGWRAASFLATLH